MPSWKSLWKYIIFYCCWWADVFFHHANSSDNFVGATSPVLIHSPLMNGQFQWVVWDGLMFFFTHKWINQFLIPVPSPSKENIPLLLVVKNRPSDNQISSYDFLKMHNFGIQPGLPITFPDKIPPRLMVKNSPLIAKINCKNFSSHPEHSYHLPFENIGWKKYPLTISPVSAPFW